MSLESSHIFFNVSDSSIINQIAFNITCRTSEERKLSKNNYGEEEEKQEENEIILIKNQCLYTVKKHR